MYKEDDLADKIYIVIEGLCSVKKNLSIKSLRNRFTDDFDDNKEKKNENEKNVTLVYADQGDIMGLECLKKRTKNPFPKYEFSLYVRIFLFRLKQMFQF